MHVHDCAHFTAFLHTSSRYFQQKVSKKHSTVKIADEVPREHRSVINTVHFTKGLEEVFIENAVRDTLLRSAFMMLVIVIACSGLVCVVPRF